MGSHSTVQFIEQREFVNGSPTRFSTSTVQYASASATWSLVTGSAAADQTTTTRKVAISTDQKTRTETVQIASTANPMVYKAIEQYQHFDWGWELISVATDPDPGGAALRHTFTYNETQDLGAPSAFGNMRDHKFPSGRWERTYYPGQPSTRFVGHIPISALTQNYVISPWKDGPSSKNPDDADLSNSQWCINYVNSGGICHGTWGQTSGFGEASSDGTTTITGATGSVNVQEGSSTDITYTFQQGGKEVHQYVGQYDHLGHYTHNMPRSCIHSDHMTDYYEYAKGTFDPVGRLFTVNEPTGSDISQTITHGYRVVMPVEDVQANWAGKPGSYYPEKAESSCSYGDLGMILNLGKSTRDWVVRRGGNIIFKQVSALKAINGGVPVFDPFEYHTYTYDSLGHLTSEVLTDAKTGVSRTLYQASWTGVSGRDSELKAWEVNELGEKTSYGYDTLKRVQYVTHLGVSQRGSYPAQSDITTNKTFDAVGRVLQQTVTAGSLHQTVASIYDVAGRITSITGADGVVTNYSYSVDTLTVTETHPGNISIVRASYLDGRPKSVTGNGVVNECYDYFLTGNSDTVNGRGSLDVAKTRTRTVYGVSTSSQRWKDKTYTYLNNLKEERAPGFGDNVDDFVTTYGYYYDLLMTKQVPTGTGAHNETSTYNGYGAVAEQRSDNQHSGSDSRYECIGDCWYLNTYSWKETSLNVFVTNSTRSRLSGFTSSSVIADCTITDPDTNITRVTITLDRPNKTVTAVTNVPQSAVAITSVTINGLLQTLNSQSVSTPTWYYYDSLGRQIAVKSPLGFWSGVVFDSSTGLPTARTNFDGKITQYQYYLPSEANSGKVKCETGPTGKVKRYDYTTRGELQHTWGDVPYPEERVYSDYGELTTLHTYRDGSSWNQGVWPGTTGAAETTTWTYDPATGLLLAKTDSSGKATTYLYNSSHVMTTKTSPRTYVVNGTAKNVTTTYTFDAAGNVLKKSYDDGGVTPTVEFGSYSTVTGDFTEGYNMNGMPDGAKVGSEIYVFLYDFAGRLTNSTQLFGALPWNMGSPVSVSSHFNPVFGRDWVGVAGAKLNLTNTYSYDSGSSRLASVTTGDCTASYSYAPNSDLLQTVSGTCTTNPVVTATRTWDYGFRLRSIVNSIGTATAVSHTYTYDGLNRRQKDLLEDASTWNYGYNDRDELITGYRKWLDVTYVAGQQFGYTYDNIGNRILSSQGGDDGGMNPQRDTYGRNDLNQYTVRTHPSDYRVDIMGAAEPDASVLINNTATFRYNDYFDCPVPIGSGTYPQWLGVTSATSDSGGQNTSTVTKHLFLPPQVQNFQYDLDGNMTNDGLWEYAWDAENRLASVNNVQCPALNSATRYKLDFKYDFMGRRTQKTVSVSTQNGPWTVASTYYYLYDLTADGSGTGGWNLRAVLDGSANLVRSFTWGQDLSGTIYGAGGIGGLVMVSDASTMGQPSTHFALYDGNGNVNALVNVANRGISARYEYSPFGQLLRATGPMATANPFRFSTKFWDDETGLVYYGHRYLSPPLGRWISRDWIGERAGPHLFAFVRNCPLNSIDRWGDQDTTSTGAAAGAAGTMAAMGAGNLGVVMNRAVEVVERCEIEGQLIGEVAENDSAIVLEEATSVYNKVATDGHHLISKFLGGFTKQDLSYIPRLIHQAFHRELVTQLRAAGVNMNVGGRGGSVADWMAAFKAPGGSALQENAMNALLQTGMNIDVTYGTTLTEDTLTMMIYGQYTAF